MIVGGQPGSGKTKVADLVVAALKRRGGAVRIGCDLYKPAHRQYAAALAADVRRERRSDVVIEADFTTVADFTTSAARFARARYRIEVVALASRAADSRQRTLVNYARALELDVQTPLPTPAVHTRACRAAAEIVVAAAADPDIAAVTVLDAGHRRSAATTRRHGR